MGWNESEQIENVCTQQNQCFGALLWYALHIINYGHVLSVR